MEMRGLVTMEKGAGSFGSGLSVSRKGGDQRSGSEAVHITRVENDELSSARSQGRGKEQLGEFLLQRLFPLHSRLRPQ